MKFSMHGSYNIVIQDSLVVLTIKGAWNLETAQSFAQDYISKVSEVAEQEWCSIINVLKWELGTPDIWGETNKVHSWAYHNNLKSEVVVHNSCIKAELLKRFHPKENNVDTHFCDSMNAAYQWLNRKCRQSQCKIKCRYSNQTNFLLQ